MRSKNIIVFAPFEHILQLLTDILEDIYAKSMSCGSLFFINNKANNHGVPDTEKKGTFAIHWEVDFKRLLVFDFLLLRSLFHLLFNLFVEVKSDDVQRVVYQSAQNWGLFPWSCGCDDVV